MMRVFTIFWLLVTIAAALAAFAGAGQRAYEPALYLALLSSTVLFAVSCVFTLATRMPAYHDDDGSVASARPEPATTLSASTSF